MDAYKYLSVNLHNWSNSTCPTCHPTHLMKQELQMMIESVREALPLTGHDVKISNADPMNVESVSQMNFIEEKGEANVATAEEEFRTTARCTR